MDRKTSSGSGRVLKLLEIFLRIYEIFQNPEKLLQIPEEVSGSGRSFRIRKNSRIGSKVRTPIIWLNTQDLVLGDLENPNSWEIDGKEQGILQKFSRKSWKISRKSWKISRKSWKI
jgi:hypothetical protein